ncbi:HEAT repeat domain-containing protein [Dactylosporangium roseum]|uniref:HEAT repeat domain-containing protein n=1 Tax=Dactylosporangium roseum TaxID=47989 RepID=A0ABY5Z023_9ACTN|nr:HEAT repeat domain-containing protein [Dactylosporangium roseum]UWZ33839.1 HEAT repeat domain-containing protein [Dactylosporangium roseum]
MGLVRRDSTAAPRDTDPRTLRERLTDTDADVRRRAALGLGGAAEAVPDLLARVPVETDPAVRDAVLTTLAALDHADVAAGLAAHLASDDAALRTAVAGALATMPASVPALLPRLLADPDHHVRIMTAMVLADLPHPGAEEWLTGIVASDPHPNVVAAAVDALLPMAGPGHVPVLESARARFPGDPFLRFTVDAALPSLREAAV